MGGEGGSSRDEGKQLRSQEKGEEVPGEGGKQQQRDQMGGGAALWPYEYLYPPPVKLGLDHKVLLLHLLEDVRDALCLGGPLHAHVAPDLHVLMAVFAAAAENNKHRKHERLIRMTDAITTCGPRKPLTAPSGSPGENALRPSAAAVPHLAREPLRAVLELDADLLEVGDEVEDRLRVLVEVPQHYALREPHLQTAAARQTDRQTDSISASVALPLPKGAQLRWCSGSGTSLRTLRSFRMIITTYFICFAGHSTIIFLSTAALSLRLEALSRFESALFGRG